ncbi:MAG: hypothetical protein RTV41_05425 [Candidatus Thorarchaeota archaeon]
MGSEGPTDEEKEAVKKQLAEMRAARSKVKHPRVKRAEENQRKEELRRKQEKAKLQAMKERDPEKFEAYVKHQAEEAKIRLEDDLVLSKKPSTWEDYAVRGLIFYNRGEYDTANHSFREALFRNPTNLIIMAYLLHKPAIQVLKDPSAFKKYDISSYYDDFLQMNDLAFLYLSVLEKGWEKKQMRWMPERHYSEIALSIIETIRPSPHLRELGKKIMNRDLRKGHWTLNVLSILTNRLSVDGEIDGTSVKAEDLIVNALERYEEGALH